MRGYRIRFWLLPMLLAAGLTACASNGVQPGIVYTSSAPPAASGPGYPANGPVQANGPAQGSNAYPAPGVVGEAGRVVSIREVGLAGSGGGGGGGNGALMGGLLGAGAGATIGAITSQTLGGGIVGAVIGLVGGAIAGTIAVRDTSSHSRTSGANGAGCTRVNSRIRSSCAQRLRCQDVNVWARFPPGSGSPGTRRRPGSFSDPFRSRS